MGVVVPFPASDLGPGEPLGFAFADELGGLTVCMTDEAEIDVCVSCNGVFVGVALSSDEAIGLRDALTRMLGAIHTPSCGGAA